MRLACVAKGVTIESVIPSSHCEFCVIAKHPRNFHLSGSERASRIPDLVNYNVCGPIPTVTPHSKRYFTLFLDDHTHALDLDRCTATTKAWFFLRELHLSRLSPVQMQKLIAALGGGGFSFPGDGHTQGIIPQSIMQQPFPAQPPPQPQPQAQLPQQHTNANPAQLMPYDPPQDLCMEKPVGTKTQHFDDICETEPEDEDETYPTTTRPGRNRNRSQKWFISPDLVQLPPGIIDISHGFLQLLFPP
ncbi:hypothetical protein C8R48DRAFT_780415 [Suillus tomentosus]|nr:hypothetical protein C8R48DRAFT_780415 [Suillus tomentosus]